MDAKKTGALIAELRRVNGMSQMQLAQQIGVTNKAISRWETGRGYPDIESLPLLAKTLGVSVQELLDGERSDSVRSDPPRTIEMVCSHAGRLIGKMKKRTRIFAVCSMMLVFLFVSTFLISCGIEMYRRYIGSPHCVVAEDYSSLTYYGQRYVPLVTDGYECEAGACIFPEVQVEGASIFGKLFFGDSLFAVRNAPNDDLLYLQTDMDVLDSCYFVRETEYDTYHRILTQSVYDQYFASDWLQSGHALDIPLEGSALRALLASEDGAAEMSSEDVEGASWSFIRVYEKEHIFFRLVGTVQCTEDAAYWVPSVYVRYEDLLPMYSYGTECYLIDEAYHDVFRDLRALMQG